jgi:hypothetical protein
MVESKLCLLKLKKFCKLVIMKEFSLSQILGSIWCMNLNTFSPLHLFQMVFINVICKMGSFETLN